MIASLNAVVIDCPAPRQLAEFYQDLLGGRIDQTDPDWVDLIAGDRTTISFQLAPDLIPPEWPDPARPQQFHLDLTVADLDEAQVAAEGFGATFELDGGSFRVMTDPAGHPFCICLP